MSHPGRSAERLDRDQQCVRSVCDGSDATGGKAAAPAPAPSGATQPFGQTPTQPVTPEPPQPAQPDTATLKGNDAMTTGRCLCGAIQYEYSGAPTLVVHCHCESCRRQTSSPVVDLRAGAQDGAAIHARATERVRVVARRVAQLLRRVWFADLLSDRSAARCHRSLCRHAERSLGVGPASAMCMPPSSFRGSRCLTTCRVIRGRAGAPNQSATAHASKS